MIFTFIMHVKDTKCIPNFRQQARRMDNVKMCLKEAGDKNVLD